MKTLFEPARIRDLEMRNRFVRSATYDAGTDESGQVSDGQLKLYSDLAEGGVGLIISSIMFVHPMGRLSRFISAIDSDDCIPGLKKLTTAVHERGAKIAVQLYHAGREGLRGYDAPDLVPLAPSVVINDPVFKGRCREMTEDEILETITAFGDAARRAREAGFDAVQLHGAHGYLLSQFFSPATNLRQDAWGGSTENRLRLQMEILKDIRSKVGPDFPVFIKFGVADDVPGGAGFPEGLEAVKQLVEAGIDAVEPSIGLRGGSYDKTEFKTGIHSLEKEAYFRDWCRTVNEQVDVPVMMMGGIKTLSLMEEIIAREEAEFISICRPLIREPDLIRTWQSGNRKKCDCISCNKCLESIRKGISLHCPVEKKLREKANQ